MDKNWFLKIVKFCIYMYNHLYFFVCLSVSIQRIESVGNHNGDKKNISVQYYYINYTVFVNVVKYKLDRMREKMQSEERRVSIWVTIETSTCCIHRNKSMLWNDNKNLLVILWWVSHTNLYIAGFFSWYSGKKQDIVYMSKLSKDIFWFGCWSFNGRSWRSTKVRTKPLCSNYFV